MRALFFMTTLLCVASVTLAQSTSDTFSRANDLFAASVAQLGKDDRAASDGLRRSAELFLSLVENEGIESSDLLTNAANARLLAGDTGEAIALYHRALRVDPGDPNARENLAVARTRASADASIAVPTPILETLTSWRRALAPPTRLRIGAIAWAALWIWAAVCVVRRKSPRWRSIVTPLVATLALSALTVIADTALHSSEPIGVVVVNAAIGRTGPDAAVYDPSFTQPLPEGVEFTVKDHRSGWVLGQLGDGRETWLPESDVRLVGL